MKFEYRIPLYVIMGGGLVVYAVNLAPPLTNNTSRSSTDTASEARYKTTLRDELAYCQANTEDVNCRCFAKASGAILTHDTPKVPNAFYADKQDLARGQAVRGC